MKSVWVLILVLCYANLNIVVAQNQIPADSLKKYSYQIAGFMINPSYFVASGTVFFLRKNDSLFLITAKHVLTGCKNEKKELVFPSIMNVWLPDSDTILPVDISIIRDTAKCLSLWDDADIISIPVKDNPRYKIFSVETYLIPPFNKIKDIQIFGYPLSESSKLGFFKYEKPSQIEVPANSYHIYETTDTIKHKTDYFNYHLYSKIRSDSTLEGFSGSPVFIRNSVTQKWRIMGVFTATGHDSNNTPYTYITKIENLHFHNQ